MADEQWQEEVPQDRDPWVGVRLGDKRQIEIVHLLGKGGMGRVYLGRDHDAGHPVAVKLLDMERRPTRDQIRRFHREGRRFARLVHPCIVVVYFLGIENQDQPFIVSEYIEGSTLYELLVCGGPLPVENALEICRDVAEGMAEAHRHRVIHRDLKPENVMVRDHDLAVKILDFGIAKDLDSSSRVTRDGAYIGTPGYSAPEQVRGDEVDARTDIFALGVILYELLAGKVAFEGRATHEVLRATLKETPLPVGRINDTVTTPVARLIDAMIQKNPQKRLATMLELIERIDAIREAVEAGCSEDDEEGIRALLRRLFLRSRPRGRGPGGSPTG